MLNTRPVKVLFVGSTSGKKELINKSVPDYAPAGLSQPLISGDFLVKKFTLPNNKQETFQLWDYYHNSPYRAIRKVIFKNVDVVVCCIDPAEGFDATREILKDFREQAPLDFEHALKYVVIIDKRADYSTGLNIQTAAVHAFIAEFQMTEFNMGSILHINIYGEDRNNQDRIDYLYQTIATAVASKRRDLVSAASSASEPPVLDFMRELGEAVLRNRLAVATAYEQAIAHIMRPSTDNNTASSSTGTLSLTGSNFVQRSLPVIPATEEAPPVYDFSEEERAQALAGIAESRRP